MIDDQLAERIKDLNWPPLMDWREFAEWVRVDAGVVEGWVKRAYIPAHKIGPHRMVNINLFWNRWKQRRFEHDPAPAKPETNHHTPALPASP